MSWRRRLLLIGCLLVLSLGPLVLPAPPRAKASPVDCTGPVIAFGRQRWCGYFDNGGNNFGDDVRIGGIPGGVDTAQELIDMVVGDYYSGDPQRYTSATFLIQTMRGVGPGEAHAVTPAEMNDWIDRIWSYARNSENGWQSFGENGHIDWSVWQHMPCGTVNTYYQNTLDDIAPYLDTNWPCNRPDATDEFILFWDNSGNVIYRIRRLCMNPMGEIGALQQPARYDLTPAISVTADGAAVQQGAEVGQTLRFTYTITNAGDPSPNINCAIYTNVHAGYFATPPTPTGNGGVGPPTGCPRAFGAGATTLTTEDVPVTTNNQTICRSLFVNPASPAVASRGVEACVPVVRKPYFRVYGGDIVAGKAWPSACTPNGQAAIVGWNRRLPTYGGAGTQYAAMALGMIFDTASAQAGGGATAGAGLSFSNTSANVNIGNFGGRFGALPCMTDYYGQMPASTVHAVTNNIGLLATGNYRIPNWTTTSGTLGAGFGGQAQRVVLYVDGDALIDFNVQYPASWTANSPPSFTLVVRGSIYIAPTVTRLDGVFIAQPRPDGTGGMITTCANPTRPPAIKDVRDNDFATVCSSPLTVNGAFIAKQVRLMRTRGTARLSTGNESNASNNIAEVFNAGPAFWMGQPVGQTSGVEYDSITGLPPVL